MRISATLSAYFGRQFVVGVLGAFLAIMLVVLLLDFIELLRRGANRETAHFGILLQMAVLMAPNTGQTIFPFAVLFGGMLAFTRMTRTHELVVARAAGVSVWQFLLPALVVAVFLGTFKVAVLNPIASVMTAKFEEMEDKVLRNRSNFLALSRDGLWIRERTQDGNWVLHARGTTGDGATLSEVTVLLFKDQDSFRGRIDARSATLRPGYWELQDTVETSMDGLPERRSVHRLATDLTLDNILDSFASPSTISFWELPRFIAILEAAGFSSARHRLYWHSQLASPLLLCAMVLIAATFSLRLTRRGGTLYWGATGLFFGFMFYFLSDLVFALGLSARVPEVLAAWAPATVTSLLGVASLLHLEDG